MSWRIVYTSKARKDAKRLAASGLKEKALGLLDVLAADRYRTPRMKLSADTADQPVAERWHLAEQIAGRDLVPPSAYGRGVSATSPSVMA